MEKLCRKFDINKVLNIDPSSAEYIESSCPDLALKPQKTPKMSSLDLTESLGSPDVLNNFERLLEQHTSLEKAQKKQGKHVRLDFSNSANNSAR